MRFFDKTLLGLLAIMPSFFTSRVSAQVSTANVLGRVLAAVVAIESNDQQVLFIQVNNLDRGMRTSQSYRLDDNSSYTILAIGDEERIQDIDLVVYDGKGKEVGRDKDAQNIAMVTLTPRREGTFKFTVEGYRMNARDGFYGIILYRLN